MAMITKPMALPIAMVLPRITLELVDDDAEALSISSPSSLSIDDAVDDDDARAVPVPVNDGMASLVSPVLLVLKMMLVLLRNSVDDDESIATAAVDDDNDTGQCCGQ